MAYRIIATSAMGTLTLTRTDAAGAVKKALELQGQAYMDVRVVDPDGSVHDADAFARLHGMSAPPAR